MNLESPRQFTLSRPTSGYLRASFDHPPSNLLNASTIDELEDLVAELSADDNLKVLVIDSVNPDFFLARYELSGAVAAGASPWAGLERFAAAATALAAAPVVTIAAIRGRLRGGGNELALACDLRFASRENALLGQPEVPSGIIPAGGGIERLARLVGRARAIEIVIGGDDFDADTAERYGWINRAIPDAELDETVDRLARRIASFDKPAIVAAKRLLSRGAVIDDAELRETIAAVPAIAAGSASRRAVLRERAIAAGADFELRLGHYLGPDAA